MTKGIGPWTLGDELGAGGNARVYWATRDDSEGTVALKVLDSTKAKSERYLRFVREVETHRSLESLDGVLPVIDAYLPDSPRSDDRAWIAMPIAVPISEALAGKPLEDVLGAVARIASTLDRLAQDHRIAHRDLKPGNLYSLNDDWLVGDFGLVSVPSQDELTRADKPLGPLHYTAYEMILNPADANPFPADVYSLAKTLWVLATESTFPPPGHQPADGQMSLANNRPHPQAVPLDRTIDSATSIDPGARPSMGALSRDLAAWAQLRGDDTTLDVSAYGARLRAKLADPLREEERREDWKAKALVTTQEIQERSRPLLTALGQLHPRPSLGQMPDDMTRNIVGTRRHMNSPEILFTWQRTNQVEATTTRRSLSPLLRFDQSVELYDTGEIRIAFMVHAGLKGVMETYFHWVSPPVLASVGSIEATNAIQNLFDETTNQLDLGVAAFVEAVEGQ